jgi:pimeloyl-ACP methyl ester carboxylesterase
MRRLERIAALAALTLSAVLVSQTGSAEEPTAPPPPANDVGAETEPVAARYDVGGRSLFLVCVGPTESHLPTVIAESGLGGDSRHFGPLVAFLSEVPFRSCAYDRAGMGQSDPPAEGAGPGAGPVTLEDGVRDLRALLAAAAIGPPYVLLGWSIGGWYVQAFANDHPEDVAGAVLLDPTHPHEVARLSAVLPPARVDEDPRVAEVRQLIANIELDPPSPEIGWLDLAASGEQARSTGDLGDLPLIVLSQGRPDYDIGMPGLTLPEPYGSRMKVAALALQDELASLSTRGEQRTVEGAGHAIQYDDPEAVVQALKDVQSIIAAGGTSPSE